MGLTIEQMALQPDVAEKARRLREIAPGVVFTSGRRTIADQARAMAQNVAVDRDYIAHTYTPSIAAKRCQAWVDAHPSAQTVPEIAVGLESVLNGLTGAQQIQLSKHLTGRAFDLGPHSCTIAQVLALKPKLFLTHEGGLERRLSIWHVNW